MILPFQTSRYLQEIKEFVAAESNGSTQLNEAFQIAIQAQTSFHELEQNLREKLQKEIENISVLESSNSALNHSLSEACGTIRCADILEHLIQWITVQSQFLILRNHSTIHPSFCLCVSVHYF
jgi:uncharacterized phage infection (PIP) family protein YhgE